MLLWTIHPRYLDNKGLGGLWFEGIIARNALLGLYKGYQNHPQLKRFKNQPDPIGAIDRYLAEIYREGCKRGFCYDRSRYSEENPDITMDTTPEQIENETRRLLEKLALRDPERFEDLLTKGNLEPHPMFRVVETPILTPETVR